jgi:hypothetical protein
VLWAGDGTRGQRSRPAEEVRCTPAAALLCALILLRKRCCAAAPPETPAAVTAGHLCRAPRARAASPAPESWSAQQAQQAVSRHSRQSAGISGTAGRERGHRDTTSVIVSSAPAQCSSALLASRLSLVGPALRVMETRARNSYLGWRRGQPLESHDVVDSQRLELQHCAGKVAALHLRHCGRASRQADREGSGVDKQVWLGAGLAGVVGWQG